MEIQPEVQVAMLQFKPEFFLLHVVVEIVLLSGHLVGFGFQDGSKIVKRKKIWKHQKAPKSLNDF